jgi:hypothetical protein
MVQPPPAVAPPKPVVKPEVVPVEKTEPAVEKTEPAASSTPASPPPPASAEAQPTKPILTPEPMPTLEPVVKPEPLPEPKVAVPVLAAPKYDVSGFFERARRIMLDRAKPLLTTHQAELAGNFTDFERVLMREARKTQYTRGIAEDMVRAAVKKWKTDGMRIPKTPKLALQIIPDIDEIATKYHEKETAIDEHLKAGLTELAGLYTLGLEKQIERLKAADDPGAIELIEKEIESTKSKPSYFPELMTGGKVDEDQVTKPTK